jgi:acyl-CoA dehydrogenase
MSATIGSATELVEAVRSIASEIAGEHAVMVDRDARFPNETIDALRREEALSAMVPRELGGRGASVEEIARCCQELGRQCAASGMIFAMHQIQVATLVRHQEANPWFERYLALLASEQRLVASVTSEVGTGGDMGSSIAAVEPVGPGICRFEKQAPTVSYGAFADDLLTTLRRAPDAEPGDQVAALTLRGQHELEPTGTWDVLGMRGTCSPGYTVRATFPSDQVLTAPFAQVSAESMVPISHILWSHVWLGIAESACERARAFTRAAAKRKRVNAPPADQRVARLMSELSMLRAEIAGALADFSAADAADRAYLSTLSGALRFNNLKISASEHTVDICRKALDVCGILGFKNDTPFSVGRQLRDAMSGPLMIANERICETNANLLMIAKEV